MKKPCHLCGMQITKKENALIHEKLLYEDGLCYIVENPRKTSILNEMVIRTPKRIVFILKEHTKRPKDFGRLQRIFRQFLKKRFSAKENVSYLIRKTMRTYPDHFHMHAFFLPLKVTEIVGKRTLSAGGRKRN
jgi:hypothetical protein